jgi:nitrite reductase/ring-hydroxylating ferredoxin subunit
MTEMVGWHLVADLAQFPDESLKMAFPRGVAVLLVRKGADIFAISNRCPHMGCPLGQGKLEGNIVRCPCHDWTFDIRTGELTLAREIKVPTYRTKVESGKVFVSLED